MRSCTHQRSKCIDSRPKGEYRYRRYKCEDCGLRFTTIEIRVPRAHRGGSLMAEFAIQIHKAMEPPK